jgi:hypothetical protein
MRTAEDVREYGVYVSECCGAERVFNQGDTFWRCPQCWRLCDWAPTKIEKIEHEAAVA